MNEQDTDGTCAAPRPGDVKGKAAGLRSESFYEDLSGSSGSGPTVFYDGEEIEDLCSVLGDGERAAAAQKVSTWAAAVAELADGRKLQVPKAMPFLPTENEVSLLRQAEGEPETLALADICCLRLMEKPAGFPVPDGRCGVEIIETVDGQRHKVYVPADQPRPHGILGFSSGICTPATCSSYNYLFFPERNVEYRCQDLLLGEILVSRGVIGKEQLDQAVQEHKRLRGRRLGRILAEQAGILPAIVDMEVEKVYRAETSLRVGEILIQAGLVSQEQVAEALTVQERLKKMRIGEFLVDQRILAEEEVFAALADKFRLPFVDLRQQKLSRKVIDMLPAALARRHLLLPLACRGPVLEVATMTPELPLKSMVLEQTGLELRKVLARPGQLRAAHRQLYGEAA